MAFEIELQKCCECGRSVAPGHGLFEGRVPSVDTIQGRQTAGKPFPLGGWYCQDCDASLFR